MHKRALSYSFAAVMILFLAALLALRFDYYYDLNDDMLMKDIVSGSYTGVPEGHNIQMLFPVSWFISLFYHLTGAVSWYGIFFLVCHFGCFFFLAVRSQSFFQSVKSKALVVLVEGFLIAGFFLYELLFLQYTVTAGLLGAAAAFLFYTQKTEKPVKEFLKESIPSILMVVLAYQIRTEMLLLIFPMICVAGVWKWSEEKEIFVKEAILKYLGVIGGIILGLLLSQMLHLAAYGSEEWRTFQNLFDSRTELYDFQTIPSFQEHKEFYEGIGLTESEQALFENYNYGIDAEIDEKTMEAVAAYAKQNKTEAEPLLQRAAKSCKEYIRLLFARGTGPQWNYLLILTYVLLLFLSLWERKYSMFWKLPLLFFVRTGLWLYIIFNERMPNRITHTLYLAEFILLGAALFVTISRKSAPLLFTVLLGFALLNVPGNYQYVEGEYNRREEVNQEYLQLRTYCRKHPEQVFFLDVYSTVAYSEKVFKDADNTLRNDEYLGGWACKSPCDEKKLKALGMINPDTGAADMEAGICENDNTYVISHVKREITWLEQYLLEKGMKKQVVRTDSIGTDEKESFVVYQVQ